MDRATDHLVAAAGLVMACIHCGRDMPPDSMSITVTDSVDSGITLARLCSYGCIVRWAKPMAATLEQWDGVRHGAMDVAWPRPIGRTA